MPAPSESATLDVQLHENEVDENGNVRHCDPGTVPMRRTTADDLARFSSLRDYYSKGRGGGQLPGRRETLRTYLATNTLHKARTSPIGVCSSF